MSREHILTILSRIRNMGNNAAEWAGLTILVVINVMASAGVVNLVITADPHATDGQRLLTAWFVIASGGLVFVGLAAIELWLGGWIAKAITPFSQFKAGSLEKNTADRLLHQYRSNQLCPRVVEEMNRVSGREIMAFEMWRWKRMQGRYRDRIAQQTRVSRRKTKKASCGQTGAYLKQFGITQGCQEERS